MARKRWDYNIGKNLSKMRRWRSTNNRIVLTPANTSKEFLGLLQERWFWQSVMERYFDEILFPELRNAWMQEIHQSLATPQIIDVTQKGDAFHRAQTGLSGGEDGKDFFETYDSDETDSRVRRRSRARKNKTRARKNMREGFSELFSALTTKVTIRDLPGFAIGPMGQVLNLQLSEYMPHIQGSPSTRSQLNTLFYAVEFGTGVFAGWDDGKPGNPSFIRLEGPTKSREYPGAWWFPSAGQGILWAGQQGFHFLFDPRTREPRQYWADFLQRTLPNFIYGIFGQRRSGFSKRRTVIKRR